MTVMYGTVSQTDQEEDYRFLHSTLMEKKLHLLFKIHEQLRRFVKRGPIPVQDSATCLASNLFEDLIHHKWREEVKELFTLFSKPHFKFLLHVHDAVAQRDYEPFLPEVPDGIIDDEEDSVKIVSLVKTKEPLMFVRALFDYKPSVDPAVPCKDAAITFKRGDILQIVSMEDDTWWQACHVTGSSTQAGLIPSQQLQERRIALQRPQTLFKHQNIKTAEDCKVFSVEDDVDYGAVTGIHIAGLRRSFRLGKKSNWAKEAPRSRRWSSGVHDSISPPTYLEVIPYHKNAKENLSLVVFVGPSGVGVNELKKRLLISDPDLYGITVPYTTREKRSQETDGIDYHFVSVQKFEEDILNRRFIDYGTYRGHYYGTSLDSVHHVLSEGKVCLLDVHPCKLKRVYTLEFKPFVVFVKPPRIEELRLTRRRAKFICDEEDTNQVRMFSEEDFEDMIYSAETMEEQHGHMFDEVIVNGDIAMAFRELKANLQQLEEAQVRWIPAEWLCSSPTKARRSCGLLAGWI
ncbi:MAGUK p55 subfamily member 7-like isoform X2 [Corythoichthys intestinalis]|uniref:MAGUK p55 subfamily member 7-like isoform X2 n=1 Tax=Corythoichthys intestinalis TaxID=161448 RepID=UPI0025A5390B|nr:MAGUK p55 subfamily member 7-like isoform X2 [Corythoichthys intestinalis]